MLVKSRSCCKLIRIEGANDGVVAIYPTGFPPEVGVRLNPEMVRAVEMASQIGASCTNAIKLPLPGFGVTGVEVLQLISVPATRAIPSIFARGQWEIRLKGLLLFEYAIGARSWLPGASDYCQCRRGGTRQRAAPFPQMTSTCIGVIRPFEMPARGAKISIHTVN